MFERPGAPDETPYAPILGGREGGGCDPRPRSSLWRHRLGVATALCTLALVFVGGLVTSTGSGLAVPDWPLSYGMLMPPMVGGIFYEHGHRMVATVVGFLMLCLAVWTSRAEPRPGVRRLAWVSLLAVILQGLLGGLTVIYLLPTPISVTHACLAQTFFCLIITLAYTTSREWASAPRPTPINDADAGLRSAAVILSAVTYVQLLLGALVRHLGAGLAIPDFPLAFGRLVPPFSSGAVAVHFAHRVGAVCVLLATLLLVVRTRRLGDPRFLRGALAILGLVLIQIALGGAAVLSGRAVVPATLHVATGAAVLGGSWLLTLRACRLLRKDQHELVFPPAVGEAAAAS